MIFLFMWMWLKVNKSGDAELLVTTAPLFYIVMSLLMCDIRAYYKLIQKLRPSI